MRRDRQRPPPRRPARRRGRRQERDHLPDARRAGSTSPDVDTILEIGGQDSKFIAVKDGRHRRLRHEQGLRGGHRLVPRGAGAGTRRRHQRRVRGAARSPPEAPSDLGSRCTVFMETEVVNALAAGGPVDRCLRGPGLRDRARTTSTRSSAARPLGRTDRVPGRRRVATMRWSRHSSSVLGRPVTRPPLQPDLGRHRRGHRGAGGAMHGTRPVPASSRVLPPGRGPASGRSSAAHCSNRCEVNVIEIGDGPASSSATPASATRAAVRTRRAPAGFPNLAEEYLARCEALFRGAGERRADRSESPRLDLVAHLPFWATFFRELGTRPVLSKHPRRRRWRSGCKHLSVGSACRSS